MSPPTIADYVFDLDKIDQELMGMEDFMANQTEILNDAQKVFDRRRANTLEDRVLIRKLADVFKVNHSTLRKKINVLGIPIYPMRLLTDGGNMQIIHAVDRSGALRLAEYYGGGDISDDSTRGQPTIK